jgi:hypothetical protein
MMDCSSLLSIGITVTGSLMVVEIAVQMICETSPAAQQEKNVTPFLTFVEGTTQNLNYPRLKEQWDFFNQFNQTVLPHARQVVGTQNVSFWEAHTVPTVQYT